jgi:lysozyme family protein
MPENDRFAACFDEVLRHEGGYADHPKDPGGATNLGITRKTLAAWRKVSPWWALDKAEVKTLGRDEAAAIYRAQYWDRCGAGEMPPGLDLAVFDYAVNSGPQRAVATLQSLLKVRADGYVGPLTLAAIERRRKARGTGHLIGMLCNSRMGSLKRLAAFSTFGRGWTQRVEAVRAKALAMAGSPARTGKPVSKQWSGPMNALAGYRTYIVAGLMLLSGLAQLLGMDLPALDGHAAGQLLMEGLAIIFLRKGLKNEIGNS